MDIQTEVDGFYKTDTGVLLNKDTDALRSYKLMKKRNALVDVLEKKVKVLEDKVSLLEQKIQSL